MPRPTSTRPPPPPDPLDAAGEALDRFRRASDRFQDADDFDDDTGVHDARQVHVHIERTPSPRLPMPSVTDADIPKNHSLAGTIATLVAAAVAAVLAKVLGKL